MNVDLIRLVQGDRNPPLYFQLTDLYTERPRDLSDPNLSVHVKFREKGATAIIFDTSCTKVSGMEALGLVYLTIPDGGLYVDDGRYEMEIRIKDASEDPAWEETCADKIPVRVVEQFGSTAALDLASGVLSTVTASGYWIQFKFESGTLVLLAGPTEEEAVVVWSFTP